LTAADVFGPENELEAITAGHSRAAGRLLVRSIEDSLLCERAFEAAALRVRAPAEVRARRSDRPSIRALAGRS
jgi:hypothetical protein